MTNRPEKIVIIGGGLLGCLTALFAARLKDPDGNAIFEVTLLDKNPHPLSGPTLAVARDHRTGMEYQDRPTGRACTEASFILNRIWEGVDHIHNDENDMQFSGDEEAARLLYYDPKDHRNYLDEMTGHENKLRAEVSLPPLGAIPLPDNEHQEYFPGTTSPIQTREKGFDIPRRTALLLLALEKAGVTIIPNFDAKKIERADNGNGFVVKGMHQGAIREIPASQVFNASAEGILNIEYPPDIDHLPFRLVPQHRSFLLVSGFPDDMPSRFIIDRLGGVRAGMITRHNPRGAYAYITHPAYANWEDGLYKAKLATIRMDYFDMSKRLFRGLERAKVVKLLKYKILVPEKKSLAVRHYLPVQELSPGLFWGAALKGIYAERMAVEAVERFRTGLLPNLKEVVEKVETEPAYRLKNALALKDGKEDPALAVSHPEQAQREIDFLEKRNMLFDGEMLNEDSYRHYCRQYQERYPSRRAGGSQSRGR